MKTNALATRQETVEDLAVTTLTTEELVVVIQQEHELVEGAASATISHAINCGLALLEARERVPDGQWVAWMAENLQMSRNTSHIYMKIAHYQAHILSSGLTSIKAARLYLKESPSVDGRGRSQRARKWSDETRKEFKRLHTEGLTYAAIEDLLGVPAATLLGWGNPEKTKRRQQKEEQRQRMKRAEARAARTALRQKERAEATKRAGGKIDKGAVLLRQSLSELGRALTEETDPDRREVLRAVIVHLTKADIEMGKV